MLDIKINALTAEAFLALYTSVGWEPPCEAQVRTALQNSLATFTAFEEGTPVGMARLIGDGGMSFYIKDFAILPSHQGKGLLFRNRFTLHDAPNSEIPVRMNENTDESRTVLQNLFRTMSDHDKRLSACGALPYKVEFQIRKPVFL